MSELLQTLLHHRKEKAAILLTFVALTAVLSYLLLVANFGPGIPSKDTTALTSTAVTAFIFMYQISKGEFNNLQESQLDLVRIAGTLLIITTAATVAICIGEVIGAVQDPLTAVFCGTSFAIFIANGLIIMMTVAFDFFSAVIATRFIWKEAA